MASRLAGRLVTGPVAFFAAGVVDWAAVLVKVLSARVRGREVQW